MGNSRHRRAPCGPGCDYCQGNLTFHSRKDSEVSESELHYFLQEGELQAWRDGWIFKEFDIEAMEAASARQAKVLDEL